jgi:hypothetical protein
MRGYEPKILVIALSRIEGAIGLDLGNDRGIESMRAFSSVANFRSLKQTATSLRWPGVCSGLVH